MRKYELRRICKPLSYAKRIAARMRNAAQKAALRREIAALEKESIALKRLLARLAERYALRRRARVPGRPSGAMGKDAAGGGTLRRTGVCRESGTSAGEDQAAELQRYLF